MKPTHQGNVGKTVNYFLLMDAARKQQEGVSQLLAQRSQVAASEVVRLAGQFDSQKHARQGS